MNIKLRASLLLACLLVSSSALAAPATCEGLIAVLTRVVTPLQKAMTDVALMSGPIDTWTPASSIVVEKDYASAVESLQELAQLTDLDQVRSRSGVLIQNISESIQIIIKSIPEYRKIVADFDRLTATLQKVSTDPTEVEKEAPQVAADMLFEFDAQDPRTQALNVISNLLFQLEQ